MEKREGSSVWLSSNFQFKYVAEDELLRIVRKVRREKQKEKDAIVWKQYVEKRNCDSKSESSRDTAEQPPVSNPCYHCAHGCHCSEPSRNEIIQPVPDKESSAPDVEEQYTHVKPVQPADGGVSTRETGYLQRVALLRHKIILALDSITGMIQCRPAEPDGPDDFERRKTRINEFLSRFSRNYLFQFQRQVAELRRQIVYASPETPGRHTEYQALMQKLVSAHQTAVQSLQAYLTQIPASLQVMNIFGKLEDLLHHLCDLSSLKCQLDVHAGILENCGDMFDTDEVYVKCKELLSILGEKHIDLEEQSLSARASSPPSGRNSSNRRSQRVLQRPNASTRIALWKKSSAYLARTKFGAPSSVRSSVSPHLSSRELQLNEEKLKQNVKTTSCCDHELKDIISHMHDILCNKFMAKKKSKYSSKSQKDHNVACNKRSSASQRTEVQNISKNVQIVLTQHCDSDVEGSRDAATDTTDLINCMKMKLEGGSKKIKRVGWATNDAACSSCNSEDLNAVNTENKSSQNVDGLTDNGIFSGSGVAKPKSMSEQRVVNYRQRFQRYNSQIQNPAIQRWCENIMDEVFHEISEELEPSFLLEKMYHLELKEL